MQGKKGKTFKELQSDALAMGIPKREVNMALEKADLIVMIEKGPAVVKAEAVYRFRTRSLPNRWLLPGAWVCA